MAATFTRKHYIEIARILSGVRDAHEKQRLAKEFARMFRQDNPQFDAERFSSAVFGEGGGNRAREVSEAGQTAHEAGAGFAVSIDPQHIIEDTASDRFDEGGEYRKFATDEGLIDGDGGITEAGWDLLNEDIQTIERNAMKWLNTTFRSARSEGHDNDDLVGTFWFDPTDLEQARLVNLAAPGAERIDMVDLSYGNFAHTAFDGVSDFGATLLGGSITFFDIKPEDMEVVQQSVERSRATRKKKLERTLQRTRRS